ncbi:hypothetical protein B0H13DRAFT_1880648 [Mycena leptocephala]|nr:hypothetical protein B0H13DRAFT_1880648 [Mycena leptocephala]
MRKEPMHSVICTISLLRNEHERRVIQVSREDQAQTHAYSYPHSRPTRRFDSPAPQFNSHIGEHIDDGNSAVEWVTEELADPTSHADGTGRPYGAAPSARACARIYEGKYLRCPAHSNAHSRLPSLQAGPSRRWSAGQDGVEAGSSEAAMAGSASMLGPAGGEGSRWTESKTREHEKKEDPRVLCDSERVGPQR